MATGPKTKKEWQEAADAAHGLLVIDSARQYGLITGGPVANIERCEEILLKAKAKGITPRPIC